MQPTIYIIISVLSRLMKDLTKYYILFESFVTKVGKFYNASFHNETRYLTN